MKRGLLLLTWMLFIASFVTYGDAEDDYIRVGLHSLCDGQNRIEVAFDGPHAIYDSAQNRTLLASLDRANKYYFSQTDGDFASADQLAILEAPDAGDFIEKETLIAAEPGTTMTINGHERFGEFSIGVTEEGRLIPVVRLPRDRYLKGVVPKEMSTAAPLDALRAQAIAARTFSVRISGRYDAAGYDICDTTSCQVYGGDDVGTAASDRAVDSTSGLILTYDGKPAHTFYHASSGGYVENSEDIFSAALPYLVAAEDPYSGGAAARQWEARFTPAELATRLAKKGYQLGRIKRWKIDEQLPSGRVVGLTIVGTGDRVTLKKEAIRSALGYDKVKSLLFTTDSVDGQFMATANALLDCDLDDCTVVGADDAEQRLSTGDVYAMTATGKRRLEASAESAFTLRGKGWGHGLGMSQVGAKEMAKNGFDFREILQFYYKNTKIEFIDEVNLEDE